jgi:hypothetical protein
VTTTATESADDLVGAKRRLLSASVASGRPTRHWTVLGLGLAAMVPLVFRRVGDPDFWWHRRTGQWMLDHGGVPSADPFTYTVAGIRWVDHEYGSQLLLYGLDRIGGLLAVSLFFGAVIWAGFWALLARIRQHACAPVVVAAALLLGAAAGFPAWGPRPQMFDFLFGAIELYWLERYLNASSRALWFLPALVVLWANVHGGFIFALYFLGVVVLALGIGWLVTRDRSRLLQARSLVVIALLCVVAGLLTPNGPALYLVVWQAQFNSVMSNFVAEWQSPDFHMVTMAPFGLMLLLVLGGFGWRRPRLHDALLVVFGAVLALRAWRFIPAFVLVATPLLAWEWSEAWLLLRARLRDSRLRSWRPRRAWGYVLLAIVAAIAAAGAGHTLAGQSAATAANYPVAAADWLGAHPQLGTRLFNEYSWGAYMTDRFYPDPNRRVFVYGGAGFLGNQLLNDYAEVVNLRRDWRQVLHRYQVDYVLFPPGKPLDAALAASAEWRRVYADSVAVIFVPV